jgi:hypothetical protein
VTQIIRRVRCADEEPTESLYDKDSYRYRSQVYTPCDTNLLTIRPSFIIEDQYIRACHQAVYDLNAKRNGEFRQWEGGLSSAYPSAKSQTFVDLYLLSIIIIMIFTCKVISELSRRVITLMSKVTVNFLL